MFKKINYLTFYLFISSLMTPMVSIYAESGSCAFCDQKVIGEQVVYEGEQLMVLIDYAPDVKGHLLVIPKRHVVKAHELTKEEWEDMSNIIPKIVNVFKTFLGTDQYVILEKNGPNAFQDVPHVHFHLLPVHCQAFSELFGLGPPIMSEEEIVKEVNRFRDYFSIIQNES